MKAERAGDGARDFDFWMGRWHVHDRRLRERLKGSTESDEFGATVVARPLPGGLGNENEYRTDYAGGLVVAEIRRTAFHWRGEILEDGGRSWTCDTEFFARRRPVASGGTE